MKAITQAAFHAPATLQDLPEPVPAAGEVVVEVAASSINAIDVLIGHGMLEGQLPYELPITLGQDVAGTVFAIGPEVTDLSVGDRVYGVHFNLPFHRGTLAQRVAISSAQVATLPASVDFATAGALGLAGTAAWTAIDAAALRPETTVMVSGATGGVGSLAVQLAKRAGARVIATADGPEQADFVRGLGADDVVNHTSDLGEQLRGIGLDKVDAVIHLAGDPATLADLITRGGAFVSTIGWGLEVLAERDLAVTGVTATPTREVLDSLIGAVSAGELTVPITGTYTLDQVPQALADFDASSRGKLSITVP